VVNNYKKANYISYLLFHQNGYNFYPAAWNAGGLSMRELSFRPSACPSVCQMRGCDKTKESSAQIFIPYERTFILVFRYEEWLVGATLVPEILVQTDPVGAKKRRF